MGWLRDSTLRVLSALFTEPGNFRGLHERTEIPEQSLRRRSGLPLLCRRGHHHAVQGGSLGSGAPARTRPAPSDDELDSTMGRSTLPPIDAERTAPARLYQNPRSETFS
jgi:hypothetical protein